MSTPHRPAQIPTPVPGVGPRHVQRGGGSVMMMLLLLGLVAILGLVEIGHLYWAKREAQKVADLAALAGAQRLELCSADDQDNRAARQNAIEQNRFAGSVAIACGNWGVDNPAADRFLGTVDDEHPRNAVKVVARYASIPFFGQNASLPTVEAQAVARRAPAAPVVQFSVGSRLADIRGEAMLGNTLRLVGVDVENAALLNYRGLAQASITPSGLLDALCRQQGVCLPVTADMSVGDFNQLLAAHRLSLGQLLEASATVLSTQDVADANVLLLRSLAPLIRSSSSIGVDQANILLGSAGALRGLFAEVVTPDGLVGNALTTRINVMDLVTTAISIAGKDHFLKDETSLLGARIKAQIIEPPAVAIGGIGTSANSSQVRVVIDLLPLLPIPITPITLDVAAARGTLRSVDCRRPEPTATIDVEPSLLNIRLGSFPPTSVPLSAQALTLEAGPYAEPPSRSTGSTGGVLNLGDTIRQIVKSLPVPLLDLVLGAVLDLLKPILDGLGAVLANLLGLQLGRTDVHVQSIACASAPAAQLVY